MKKALIAALAVAPLMMTGCSSLIPYIEGSKLTVCTGDANITTTCPAGFAEFDGTMIPRVGGYTTPVSERITTCVDYSDENMTCPSSMTQIVIDLI